MGNRGANSRVTHPITLIKRFGLASLGLAIALLLSGLFSVLPPSAQEFPDTPHEPIPNETLPPELRGVWLTNIDSEVLFSQDNVQRSLQRLHRLNFNTLYPTVWNWGYTLYPSPVADAAFGHELDPHPGLQGRDMLQEIVDQGHDQGMAVIPWFEFGLMAPSYSDLARQHPDWLTQRSDGTQVKMEGDHPRVWLNPLHPEVRQLILDLIGELAANYEIDGIQLDDHFGMPVEFGYDPYTVEQYRRSHNGQSPPEDPTDADWKQWRADQITDLMVQVFETIKANRPDCLVALSPNPRQFSYDQFLQDWWRWEREGYIEELIVQVYRNDLERFVYELEQPEIDQIRTHIPLAIGILTGLRDRPVEMSLIQDQVNIVRDYNLAGVSFFFYESLGDRDSAFQELFPTPTRRPTLADMPEVLKN